MRLQLNQEGESAHRFKAFTEVREIFLAQGASEGAAQFWSLEHPNTPGYAQRYGIPQENISRADFIETATLRPGSEFVTRTAPPVGQNCGGGIEVVVSEGGVNIGSHSSL